MKQLPEDNKVPCNQFNDSPGKMNKSEFKIKFNARWLYFYTMCFLVHMLIGSFSFITAAEDTKVYDKNYNVKYRVEGDRIYDKDWNLRYRIKDDKIYDKDWNLQYRIEGDKIYDRKWNLRYRKEDNNIYDKDYRRRYRLNKQY